MKRACLIFLSLTLLFEACVKNRDVKEYGSCIVDVKTSIEDISVQTKITGTSFDDSDEYGIFVCKSGSTSIAHKSNSWNMRARRESNNWSYYYINNLSQGSTTGSPYEHLTLTARDDGAKADLYAYYPYNQSAYSSGPEAVPFTIWGQYMYAVENTYPESDPLSNKGLDPSPASGAQSAHFTFRNLLSRLVFRFKLKNTPSYYLLYGLKIYLRDPDGDNNTTAKLYSSGTFNATTGTINPGAVPRDSVSYTISYPYVSISRTETYSDVSVFLVPTDVADNELEVCFQIENQITKPFKILRSYLLHDDGITYGFQPGYTYTFDFTLDNYVYFDGFHITSDWDTDELGHQEI